mmetsp:Transcript_27648/g.54236  ORF Transcript_27648/g.54236 Transcript_27648/m.54236 type:complete len:124 (-) Transcript_27648:1544-1915(-)
MSLRGRSDACQVHVQGGGDTGNIRREGLRMQASSCGSGGAVSQEGWGAGWVERLSPYAALVGGEAAGPGGRLERGDGMVVVAAMGGGGAPHHYGWAMGRRPPGLREGRREDANWCLLQRWGGW